ncbi:hypothetical protein CH252_04940 [Rhodococcus sp. 06-1477-1B]|nr:hypothetical protein CH252_04940 [Rhodococcus sp. 06-1477-1B]
MKDGEPKPLAFGGNEYAIIYVDKLTRVFDTTTAAVTIEAARKAWDKVKWNHIPNDRITIGGITYVLIDSEFTEDGRIRYGYTGIKIPATKPFPQL